MAEQTDLLDGLSSAPETRLEGTPLRARRDEREDAKDVPEPPWRELHIGERRYRWRMVWSEVDRTRWSPEDRVQSFGQNVDDVGDGPYRPPGPAFELEFWTHGIGWRGVRYFDRLVEVWGLVRGEALEEWGDG